MAGGGGDAIGLTIAVVVLSVAFETTESSNGRCSVRDAGTPSHRPAGGSLEYPPSTFNPRSKVDKTMSHPKTVAAVGYSSDVSRTFVEGLLTEGVSLRMLTRDPEKLSDQYPQATVIRGSLMEPDNVAEVMDGVDAAVVLTPGAQRNDATTESRAAAPILAGAKKAHFKHLIYTSVLAAGESDTGVGRYEGKADVERQLIESRVPYSILRCATYMDDFFDPRLEQIRQGRLVFPVTKSRRFSYTSQKDFAPFVVSELLAKDQILNRAIDFVEPSTYDVHEIARLLSDAAGTQVKVSSKFPLHYLMTATGPYFRLRGHSLGWVMPLIRYWDRHGNVATGEQVSAVAPDFRMTTLTEHLTALLRS